MTLRAFGLSVFRHPTAGSAVSLGYSEESIVTLPDNACLDLQTEGVCADRHTPSVPSIQ